MANLKVSEQAYPSTRYTEGSAPATPASGEVIVYAKADGLLYGKDDAGTETGLSNAAAGSVATDAIWDAAGDLAVGTGANTAAKLTIGAAGAHLSRINGAVAWDAGTSNPTAVDNDRYFRTDVLNGVPIVYDGTRWLTEQIFVARGSIAAASANGSGEQYIAPYAGTDLWLIDFGWTYNITPTHSGTQFWDVVLHKYEATGATDTTLVTLVSDKSSTIWVNPAATSIGALLGTTIDLLYVTTVKHSTPSNMNAAWRLRYQLVVT